MRVRKITAILLFCCIGWSHVGLAADDGDGSVSSAAQQALRLAYENEVRLGLLDRARFHQRFVLDKTEYLIEFGWDGERQFQRTRDTEHRVYDGATTSSLIINTSPPRLTIRNKIHDALHGWPEWNLDAMFPISQHWWTGETENRPPSQWEPFGSEVIDGLDCFVYAGLGSTFEDRPQAKRIWVDSSGNVRRLEEYLGSISPSTPPTQAIENGEIYRRITYREYHRYGQVNVPTILEIEGFGEYLVRTITTELVEFQPEFTAITFVLDIPVGTEVYDVSREPPESYTYPAEQMTEAALQERRAQFAAELAETRQEEEAQKTLVGTNAPELVIDKWLNGDAYSLDDLKGKWVLLDFTSISCGPCLSTIPFLNEAIEEFKDKPVQVVSIHSHVPAEIYRDIEGYISEHEIKFAIGVSSKDSNYAWGKVFSAYKVSSIPQAALIDPNGQIVSLESVWEAFARLRRGYYWGASVQRKEPKGEQ